MRPLFQILGYLVIIPQVYINFVYYVGVDYWLTPKSLMTIGFYLAIGSIGYALFWLRKNKTAKKEWTESIKEGGIEER